MVEQAGLTLNDEALSARLFQQLIAELGNLYGRDFFAALVEKFATVLEADLAVIALLDPEDCRIANTQAIYLDGTAAANFSYAVAGSPCQRMVGRTLLHYPEGVEQKFPDARLIQSWQMTGFLGIPLCDHRERPLGHLVVASRQRLTIPQAFLSYLPLLANRAESELSRIRTEQRLLSAEMDLQQVQALASLGSWVLNLDVSRMTCSAQMLRLFGLPSLERVVSRDAVLEKIHPDDRQQIRQLAADSLMSGKPYTFVVRLPQPDGSLRWIRTRAEPITDETSATVLIRGISQDISLQIASQQHLSESEARYRALVDASPYGILEIDVGGEIVYANQIVHDIFGYPDPQLVGRSVYATMPKTIRAEMHRQFSNLLRSDMHFQRYQRKGLTHCGRLIDLDVAINQRLNEQGEVIGFVSFISDITDNIEAELRLRQLSTAVEQSPSAILITDVYGDIEYVNPAFEHSSGYSSDEVLGCNPRILQSPQTAPVTFRQLWDTVTAGKAWRGELLNQRKNGDTYWELVSIAPISDQQGRVTHYVGIKEDITLRKQQEQQLAFQANYDPVTGLPNRLLAMDRLEHSIGRCKREGDHALVMFVDLDQFKRINDSFGHSVGDHLLIRVAELLKTVVRSEDTIARFGGDEFLLIVDSFEDVDAAERITDKVLRAFNTPVYIEDHELFITASIGVAVYPQDGADTETLLRNADAAMYIAKARGRNGFHFFTPEMNVHAKERLLIESHLQRAMEFNELVLHYQPIIDAGQHQVVGCEALIRWQNPVLGNVAPDRFIPLAEDLGLINELGYWIIEQALQQYVQWQADLPEHFRLCINVSPKQLQKNGFARGVLALLEYYRLSPGMLELEVTEGLLLGNSPEVDEQIDVMTAAGIRLSIDDFGTGYASISYLRHYPFSTLKIDKSFVLDILDDPGDATLVQSVIAMAQALGLRTVAEGVESQAHQHALQALGCDLMQGYLYSPAVSGTAFIKRMRELCMTTPDVFTEQ